MIFNLSFILLLFQNIIWVARFQNSILALRAPSTFIAIGCLRTVLSSSGMPSATGRLCRNGRQMNISGLLLSKFYRHSSLSSRQY